MQAVSRDSATGTHDSMSLAFNPLLITYVVTWTIHPHIQLLTEQVVRLLLRLLYPASDVRI